MIAAYFFCVWGIMEFPATGRSMIFISLYVWLVIVRNFTILISLFPLFPVFFVTTDNVCKEVECGKGTCKPSSNRTFMFECECDPGWSQTRSKHDDDLKFLPCVVPNCKLSLLYLSHSLLFHFDANPSGLFVFESLTRRHLSCLNMVWQSQIVSISVKSPTISHWWTMDICGWLWTIFLANRTRWKNQESTVINIRIRLDKLLSNNILTYVDQDVCRSHTNLLIDPCRAKMRPTFSQGTNTCKYVISIQSVSQRLICYC